MDILFRTIIVAVGWLAITAQPGVARFDMAAYLLAGALFQLAGGNE